MKTIIVKFDDGDTRLDRWFKRYYPSVPFSLVAKLIRKGQIKLNGKKADIADRVNEKDEISFKEFLLENTSVEEPSKAKDYQHDKKFQYLIKDLVNSIIFKDDNIIVLNKPAGLAVQGGTKVKYSLDDLMEHLQFEAPIKPKLVHRLDRETSGLLILARTQKAAKDLSHLFQRRRLEKKYVAIVNGCPRPFEGKIEFPLEKIAKGNMEKAEKSENGKAAITKYRVLDHAADRAALVEFELVTGRTHQIRAHIAMLNHPILGDDKYGSRQNGISGMHNNLFLHSRRLAFKFLDRDYEFEAPLPKHFREALKELGLSE